ncbi:MAG: aldehyde dehydrogenase family protein, partial [Acidobacteriota bacterium]
MTTSPRPRPLSERAGVGVDSEVHFIDGARLGGEGELLEVTYPVTGEVLVRVQGASSAQVDAAISAARASFDAGIWRRRPPTERAEILKATGACLAERRDELVHLVMLDNGKTRGEAEIDVLAAVGACRAAADSCLADREITLPAERGVIRKIWREPVGVVAAITPFNAPLMFAALKAAPALAAGNSVVLKPSERAPLVPVALCEAARQAGLPGGVLNLVHGTGDVAATLCDDDRVDMISLTGGVATGTAVMRAAATTIKNVLLELGGKSAHIVLADADLSAATAAAAAGIFRNAGQRCFSGSRLILEEPIADEVE